MLKIGRKHPTWHVKPRTHKTKPFVRALGTDICDVAGSSDVTAWVADWNLYQNTRAYQIEAERKRAMGIISATRNVTR
jgi:hypothetical protein